MSLISTYRSQGKGSTYIETTIEIIGSSSGTFEVSEPGVQFNTTTSERDQHALWSGMTAEFTIQIKSGNTSAIETFISDLSTTSEDKYFCKITVNGDVRFIGMIQSEGSSWDDEYYTTLFTIHAYDGIGRLEGKDYATDFGAPYGGYETIEKSIYNCIKHVGTGSQSSGVFYKILHNKTADGQAVSGNPMSNQRVNQLIWYDPGDDTGTYAFKTCKEVLTDIMVAYGLCIRYIGPYFLIYEPHLLGGGGTAYDYDSGGSMSGSSAWEGVGVEILNDKNLDADRSGGSGFSALPPMYKSIIVYDHGDQDVNMLYGISYKGNNAHNHQIWEPTEVGSITVRNGEVVVLQFSGKLMTKSTSPEGYNDPRFRNHRYHFRIHLYVVSGSNTGYWEHTYLPKDFYSTSFSNFNTPQWNYSEVKTFDIVTDIHDKFNANIDLYAAIGFDTLALVDDAVSTVFWGFEFVRVFDELLYIELGGAGEGVATVNPASNPVFCEWVFDDLSLIAIEGGNILKRPKYSQSVSYGSIKNDLFFKGTTHIGDGPGKSSLGRIQALIGGEWKDTATWGGKRLHQKSADEIQGSRNTAVRVLTGGFYSLSYWYGNVTYHGIVYQPMSVRYDSGTDLWSGEWVQFKTGSLGAGIHTKVRKKETVPLPGNPNKLPDDERLQDRITKIITGEDGYIPTGTYDEIKLRDPAQYDMWQVGDKISIIDPVIGYVDTLEVREDLREGDTVLLIEDWTPNHDYPPGSYLELDYPYSQSMRKNWQLDEDFSGTTWPITVAKLPDPLRWVSGKRRAEISKRITLTKNGQVLIYLLDIDDGNRYEKGYSIVRSGDDNNVIFTEACVNNVVQIIFEN